MAFEEDETIVSTGADCWRPTAGRADGTMMMHYGFDSMLDYSPPCNAKGWGSSYVDPLPALRSRSTPKNFDLPFNPK